MSKGIAFLAGMGSGYLTARDREEQRKIAAERDKRDADLHKLRMDEAAQNKADKDALRAAAAPVAVESGEVYQPAVDDEGNAMPANPTAGTFKVVASRFAERGVADAEAAKANDPKAVRGRVMSTLASQGNVVAADQMRTSGMQADAAQVQLDAAKRAEANQVFDQGLREAVTKGPDALAQFMSDSAADGKGGAVKFKAVVLPDGKSWQMHRVSDDGKLTPVANPFPNDENGMATAGFMLSRAVPEKDKLAHMLALREADRRAENDKAQIKIAQQNANTNEQYRRDQAENMRRQRELQAAHDKAVADGKAKAGDPIQVSLKDMRDFEGDLNGYIKDQFPVKEGADEKERASINAQATAKKALGSAMFKSNAAVGIPLTAGTVLQAMELATDRKNVRVAQINGVPHEAVVVNGQAVIVSGPLQQRPAAPAAAPGAATPAAAARAGVSPAPAAQAPAAAPQAPQAPAIAPEKVAALQPLQEAVSRAAAMVKAAGQSGDPRAVGQYAPALEQARQQLAAEATKLLGPNEARAYLSTLPI